MRRKKAFTLIELLIVIAIIGILATLIIVFLGDASAKSKDASIKSNASHIKTALERYKADKGKYPTAVNGPLGVGNDVASPLLKGELSPAYIALNSGVFTHTNKDAEYVTDSTGAKYLQAWSLWSKIGTNNYFLPAQYNPTAPKGVGDGVYGYCTSGGTPYPSCFRIDLTPPVNSIGGVGGALYIEKMFDKDPTMTLVYLSYGPD